MNENPSLEKKVFEKFLERIESIPSQDAKIIAKAIAKAPNFQTYLSFTYSLVEQPISRLKADFPYMGSHQSQFLRCLEEISTVIQDDLEMHTYQKSGDRNIMTVLVLQKRHYPTRPLERPLEAVKDVILHLTQPTFQEPLS